MSEEHTDVPYALALTRVHIAGSAETEAADGDRRKLVTANARVELRTAADPHDWLTLRLPEKAAADRAFTLKLTEDGRLSTTDVTATGRAGSAVRTLVSTVTTVAGVALGMGAQSATLGGGGAAEGTKADGGTWELIHSDLKKYLDDLKTAEEKLRNALAQAYAETASAIAPADRRAAIARAEDVDRVLEEVRKERAAVEAHRSAFLKARVDRRSQHHSFILDVEDLPTEQEVGGWPSNCDALTPEVAGDSWGPWDALGVLVTRRDITPLRQDQVPAVDGSAHEGVWYRRTRQVELRVYRRSDLQVTVQPSQAPPAPPPAPASTPSPAPAPAGAGGSGTAGVASLSADPVAVAERLASESRQGDGRASVVATSAIEGNGPQPWLTLLEQREVHVVDDHCAYGYVPFRTAWFGERTSALTFGPYGTPLSIGSSATSALKAVAEEIGSLPQQVLSGLEIANKIVDQGETAVRQTEERRLSDLTRRQAILEQELETADLRGTAELRSELALVKAEQDLLTGRRDLHSVARELALQVEATPMWARAQLDEMSNAILRERVERLELEGDIRGATADLALAPLEFAKQITSLVAEIAKLKVVIEMATRGELPPDPQNGG